MTTQTRRRYRFKVGDLVRSRREMRNGYAVLPAGTLFTVHRRFSGYDLESHPCDKCGVQIRMTRVADDAVEADNGFSVERKVTA